MPDKQSVGKEEVVYNVIYLFIYRGILFLKLDLFGANILGLQMNNELAKQSVMI
jgi:hypothetical protein